MAAAARTAVDVVIAGAGACGVATARYLHRLLPTARVALVSDHSPMQYTSALSSECFRDHWPSELMRAFMGRSIALLDAQAAETGNAFNLQRRGYLYVSQRDAAREGFLREATECHGDHGVRAFDAGVAPSLAGPPPPTVGADVYLDAPALHAAFPWLHPGSATGLHARNAGWISAQTMGMTMLDEATHATDPVDGLPRVQVVKGTVSAVDTGAGCDRVRGVTVTHADGRTSTLSCGAFVNAGGPFVGRTHLALFPPPVAAAPGTALPVYSELHAKVVFRDTLGVIPRDAPMTISADELTVAWSAEELEHFREAYGDAVVGRLTAPMPPGAHFRPYGGDGSDAVLLLWEAWHHGVKPSEPPPEDPDGAGYLDHGLYPEVALRGLSSLVPDLAAYYDEAAAERLAAKRAGGGGGGEPKPPYVDGGYYTKVAENIPLVGPAPGPGGSGAVAGAVVCGAVSGYGLMAAHAAGELAALHVVAGTSGGGGGSGSSSLPPYARLLSPLRYQDPEYTRPGGVRDQLLAAGGGQL
jgi:sarcosine oxidase, subunit beta